MSFAQNISYSAVQVVHNLGAVTVVGSSLTGIIIKKIEIQQKLAWVALVGWAIQGLTGASFAFVSYSFYHKLPEISGIALYALIIKITCTLFGFLLLVPSLYKRSVESSLFISGILSITALSAAAFLRWFS